MTSLRSTKGCHTCRIRKKKCDEGHPACANCICRRIPCYGYDPVVIGKQDWVQMEVAIRKAAEMNYKERRKQLSHAQYQKKKEEGTVMFQGEMEFAVPSSHLITWDSTNYQQHPPRPPDSQPHSSPDAFGSNKSHATLAGTTTVARTGPTVSDMVLTPLTGRINIFWDECFSTCLIRGRPQEVLSLVHYFQHVFPLQFGFFPQFSSVSSERRHIGFLDLVLRSMPLYYSCLSLSVCHHDLLRAGFNRAHSKAIMSNDFTRTHSTSLIEIKKKLGSLEKLSGSALLIAGAETLASVQQLLSVEIFHDVDGFWELHFAAARNIFDLLCKRCIFHKSSIPTSLSPTIHEERSATWTSLRISHDSHCLPPGLIPAVSFILAWFLRNHILSQACGFLSPVQCNPTTIRYAEFLEPQPLNSNALHLQPIRLDLQRQMGCENWAMLSIMKISSLEAWKNDEISNDRLSIFELQCRASILLRGLESGINTLIRKRESVASSSSVSDSDSSIITELFARAAITYLHVVVVGPKPHLPDIRRSVSRTVKVLRNLSRRNMIRISWPFTITGCMAIGGEQRTFSEIMKLCIDEGINTGSAWKGMAVMEECWKVTNSDLNRSMDGVGFGWVEAMKVLKQKILLC